MSGIQMFLGDLNRAFSKDNIEELVKHQAAFEPGKPFVSRLIVKEKTLLQPAWRRYLQQVPEVIQRAIFAVIHYALSTKPPTPITFAWSPAYDYELTITYGPDTRQTRGGITILLKSRYPDDKHPLAGSGPSRTRKRRT
jgi:hypothetical protein